jgi:acetyltransferase
MGKMAVDSFITKNGLLVWVRPMLPEDAPYLVEIFEHMSADSRYFRFNQPLTHVAPERVWTEAENIAHLEPQIGFIAFADLPEQSGVPIGAARCVFLGDGVAETAVSVCDDMQNQGIATSLLGILIEAAKRQGVRKLVATVQNANRPILHMLNRLPYVYTRKTIGSDTEVELDLTSPKVEIETRG